MSLFPLGLLSQGGGGGAAGAFEQIATAYGTGSSGVIDFTSIPATYKHLQIRYTAKNTSTSADLNITFNNVTSSSYARHHMVGNSVSTAAASAIAAANISLIDGVAPSTTANVTTNGVIDILDYSQSTKNKTLRAMYGLIQAYSTSRIYVASGVLDSTTVVSRVTLTASGNNFSTTSRFSLYGIKG
jgi:hypothetical protein